MFKRWSLKTNEMPHLWCHWLPFDRYPVRDQIRNLMSGFSRPSPTNSLEIDRMSLKYVRVNYIDVLFFVRAYAVKLRFLSTFLPHPDATKPCSWWKVITLKEYCDLFLFSGTVINLLAIIFLFSWLVWLPIIIYTGDPFDLLKLC
jgi:hypothetical protein